MMIPAVTGAGMPSPAPMPMRAMPTVPEVPQEVPVDRATMEQMSRAVRRKTEGFRMDRP